MKLSRLLTYGAAGIISGLLLENAFMNAKQKAAKTTRKAAKETGKLAKKTDKIIRAKA